MTAGRRFRAPLLALACASACAPAAGRQTAERPSPAEEHGSFTGEIKAVVYVSDVKRSAEFYRDVLGFELLGFSKLEGEEYYAELAAGGPKLGLHEPTSEGDDARVGRIKLYFRVRDVGAHRTGVAARGGRPGPLRETAWMTMFTVIDPDGNQIVFAETDPRRHTIDPW